MSNFSNKQFVCVDGIKRKTVSELLTDRMNRSTAGLVIRTVRRDRQRKALTRGTTHERQQATH